MGDQIIIGQMCDGWEVQWGEERFSWNHNEEDLGVNAIAALLEHAGYDNTVIEEWY